MSIPVQYWFPNAELAGAFAEKVQKTVQEGNRTGRKDCKERFFVLATRDEGRVYNDEVVADFLRRNPDGKVSVGTR
jgi:hypothetical protein